MRQLVERNLIVAGEALIRLRRIDPDTAARITAVHRIIGLRNRLAHGYEEEIDHALLWEALTRALPTLNDETIELLKEAEAEFGDTSS